MKTLLLPALFFLTAAPLSAQTPALAPLPVNGFVTLEQIVSDFRTNADAALQKYGGNQITVFGRVGQVEQPGDGENVLNVYLQVFKNPTPDVKAVFAADAFPENAQIQFSADGTQASVVTFNRENQPANTVPIATVDERIGIRGSFSDYQVGDIILKNCRKVSSGEVEKLMGGQ